MMTGNEVFSKKLKALRKEKGLSLTETAKSLKISKSTLCNYESAYCMPRVNTMERICAFFDVSLEYLLDISSENDGPKYLNASRIPIYAPDYAGEYLVMSHENILGYVKVPGIKNIYVNDYVAFKIRDDGMNLYNIQLGDIVIVKMTEEYNDGDIVAVLNEGGAMVRMYHRDFDTVTLSPVSTEKRYLPKVCKHKDIKIFGTVHTVIANENVKKSF